MKKLLELFFTFAKVGLFTFGGGYAMLPLIERTCVEKKKWITGDEMTNITVLAESTPGPVAINCSTYVGNKQKGFIGALFATLGMVTPSFIIILAISFFLERFMEVKWVAGAFYGIKLAVAILIIDAAIRMFRKLEKKPLTYILAAFAFAAMMAIDIASVRISSVVIMLICATVSLIVYLAKRNKKKEESKGFTLNSSSDF
jgi:chromate transporter